MTDSPSDLPPLHLESVLPPSDRWLRWSTAVLVSSLALFTGLSAGLTFDQTVSAQGVIRPKKPYPVVSTSAAGTLSSLHISENDSVAAAQILGTLQVGDGMEPLIAPQNGVVFQLASDLLGKSLPAGTPVTHIAPLESMLTLTLQVDTEDIGQLSVGQLVQARVSAYPYPDYGILEGRIETIAPDVTPCSSCSTPYGYVVNVRLPQAYLQHQEIKYPLAPGMDADVDIVTQRARLLSIILKQLRLATDI